MELLNIFPNNNMLAGKSGAIAAISYNPIESK
jgi:hypothetical protein